MSELDFWGINMKILSSYIAGEWCSGTDEGSALYDPVTEAVVARTSTAGLSIANAFESARTNGLQSLREMTFRQRGELLEAMSKCLHEAREDLIEIGRVNGGNTRGDAKFDIDGGTATLMYYAKLGAKLGDRKVLLDGEAITIGGARMQGQHVLSTRPGVAVHINASNFPVWGLAEKAACAILAGMPVISKPATSTAWMTWHAVKVLDAANLIPSGVLSLICGSARDLLDHVSWSDVVAFTGGAETAHTIRTHPRVLETGALVNVEADSLNATVLVPGVEDETYDAFIRDVHREMTQKSGQKCTATRRIFVPLEQMDEVIEDLGEKLNTTRVGDPGLDGIQMGPLSSMSQKASALVGIEQLLTHGTLVYGHPTEGALEGVTDGKGAFIQPTLIRANETGPDAHVHNIEVFGPVASIIGYDSTVDDVARQVSYGQGCLVTAVYGDDRSFLADFIAQTAPWNGRIVMTDAKIAAKSYSPGMVLPHLLHGGPGRAGGGEELGGVRGMRIYQQRTAVQGNGPLISKLLGAD